MIKRLILVLLILIIIPIVNAGTMSISPARFSYFFEPNFEKTIKITTSSSDPNQSIDIYVLGDLSNYTNLSRNVIIGGGDFIFKINLPEKIDIPGNHKIFVGAIESNKNQGEGIGAVAAVQATIDIFVPYPGKYAEASFNINDINEGENISYFLEISNLGTEDFTISPLIKIYDTNKKEIISKQLESETILSKEKKQFLGVIDHNFNAGPYLSEAIFNYGKEIILNSSFRVGMFNMNLTDYSYVFEEEKINKFDIEAENLWNSKIENVYSEVIVTDNGNVLDRFKTSSANFEPWQKQNLTGFFDATKIKEGKYLANIFLYYSDKKVNKLVTIYVNKAPPNPLLKRIKIMIIFIGVFFIVLILIIIYLAIKLKNKKTKKYGKRKH